MATDARATFLRRTGSAGLWFAVFGAPLAWFVALVVAYALPAWACAAGRRWPLHAVYVVALVVCGGALLSARRIRRTTGDTEPGEAGGPLERTRFLAALGILASTLFGLVTLAQWIATFVIGPCQLAPRLPDSPDVLAPPAVQRLAERGGGGAAG
ncbi:MAG TPA: hypothetical protein VFQ38_09950 [Longimicrobiales bacterium]|nr:hypothetical protein [Longimicrobiales bacterium]